VLYLVVALIAVSAGCMVGFLATLVPGRSAALSRRLEELRALRAGQDPLAERRARQHRSERVAALLEALGTRLEAGYRDLPALRLRLVQAGFPQMNAASVYLGTRVALPTALAGSAVLLLGGAGVAWNQVLLSALWLAVTGYVLPPFYVGSRLKIRQKELQKALPDALDLLVVCVEAGLALNQALVRVAEEMHLLSPVLSDQFALTNLEIRAGTPRDEAFRNLGERTGVLDLKSLMTMLIQTDRFGTSIATALRVHADTLRTKRRQRAEEAAAKTTIKLVFPLVFFIFPAMFVVIIGPALIQIFEALSGF
jgi:tight adherence protein C